VVRDTDPTLVAADDRRNLGCGQTAEHPQEDNLGVFRRKGGCDQVDRSLTAERADGFVLARSHVTTFGHGVHGICATPGPGATMIGEPRSSDREQPGREGARISFERGHPLRHSHPHLAGDVVGSSRFTGPQVPDEAGVEGVEDRDEALFAARSGVIDRLVQRTRRCVVIIHPLPIVVVPVVPDVVWPQRPSAGLVYPLTRAGRRAVTSPAAEARRAPTRTSQIADGERCSAMKPVLSSPRSRMRSSHLGGVPSALDGPEPAERPVVAQQLDLGFGDVSSDEPPVSAPAQVSPLADVVHISGWLTLDEQRALVTQFRLWALPPAGLRHPRVPTGHLMSIQSVCLGWHWQPYAYSRTADDTDGAPVKPLPDDLIALARRACRDVIGAGTGTGSSEPDAGSRFEPDAAIVNFYGPGARLGLHQDGDEPSDAPVVTISLGDTGTFRMAGVGRRTAPFTDIELRSGDLLVFGGRNRRIYHGITKVHAGTAPDGLDLPPGRLSITVRETGLQ
jgi:alkylated DNA repair protein (DNA oxidative demethylase)